MTCDCIPYDKELVLLLQEVEKQAQIVLDVHCMSNPALEKIETALKSGSSHRFSLCGTTLSGAAYFVCTASKHNTVPKGACRIHVPKRGNRYCETNEKQEDCVVEEAVTLAGITQR